MGTWYVFQIKSTLKINLSLKFQFFFLRLMFAVWLLIGFVVYYCYGIRNSKENIKIGRQNFFIPCLQTNYNEMHMEMEPNPSAAQLDESTKF